MKNKLIITNDEIFLAESDKLIDVEISNKFALFDINKIKITVKDNTELIMEAKNIKDIKLDITIKIKKNKTLTFFDFKIVDNLKIKYNYDLKEKSYLNITKFYDCNQVKELDIANMNGNESKIDYNLKTISKSKQNYDFIVYHNYQKTESNIIHSGANIKKGNLNFNLTGIVYNNIKNCVLNQNSRIINFTTNRCNINPNLLIEENDVIANHSALIGNFSAEELFYLQSRGIPKKQALNLLVKGFLLEGITNDEIERTIDKYWG